MLACSLHKSTVTHKYSTAGAPKSNQLKHQNILSEGVAWLGDPGERIKIASIFITFLFSEHIPQENVCSQLLRSVRAFGGFILPSIGQRSAMKKLSLLHLGRGDPSK